MESKGQSARAPGGWDPACSLSEAAGPHASHPPSPSFSAWSGHRNQPPSRPRRGASLRALLGGLRNSDWGDPGGLCLTRGQSLSRVSKAASRSLAQGLQPHQPGREQVGSKCLVNGLLLGCGAHLY